MTASGVRAKLRLMVKRILRTYKYPPDSQEDAVDLVLRLAQVLGESWGSASAWYFGTAFSGRTNR